MFTREVMEAMEAAAETYDARVAVEAMVEGYKKAYAGSPDLQTMLAGRFFRDMAERLFIFKIRWEGLETEEELKAARERVNEAVAAMLLTAMDTTPSDA